MKVERLKGLETEEIMRVICERNGVKRDFDTGAVTLQVGGGAVYVLPDFEQDELHVLAPIGAPPADGAAEFELQMLQENFERAETSGAYLSFDDSSGLYVAVETATAAGLDADALQGIVTALADLRDGWRGRLADSRPCEPVGEPTVEGAIMA